MRCTDLSGLTQKVRDQIKRELTAAVRAHGGDSYTFFTEEDPIEKDGPLVEAIIPFVPSDKQLCMVSSVRIWSDGDYSVYGYVLNRWEEEIELDGLELEDIQLIIMAIPATEAVKSVVEDREEESYVVLKLYPDDVELAGYNIDGMLPQTFKRIAEVASEGLKYDFLRAAIQAACDELKLNRFNKDE